MTSLHEDYPINGTVVDQQWYGSPADELTMSSLLGGLSGSELLPSGGGFVAETAAAAAESFVNYHNQQQQLAQQQAQLALAAQCAAESGTPTSQSQAYPTLQVQQQLSQATGGSGSGDTTAAHGRKRKHSVDVYDAEKRRYFSPGSTADGFFGGYGGLGESASTTGDLLLERTPVSYYEDTSRRVPSVSLSPDTTYDAAAAAAASFGGTVTPTANSFTTATPPTSPPLGSMPSPLYSVTVEPSPEYAALTPPRTPGAAVGHYTAGSAVSASHGSTTTGTSGSHFAGVEAFSSATVAAVAAAAAAAASCHPADAFDHQHHHQHHHHGAANIIGHLHEDALLDSPTLNSAALAPGATGLSGFSGFSRNNVPGDYRTLSLSPSASPQMTASEFVTSGLSDAYATAMPAPIMSAAAAVQSAASTVASIKSVAGATFGSKAGKAARRGPAVHNPSKGRRSASANGQKTSQTEISSQRGCSHIGCNFKSGGKTKQLRHDSVRRHEKNIALHKKHIAASWQDCPCCQNYIADGVWSQVEVSSTAAAAASAAAASSKSSKSSKSASRSSASRAAAATASPAYTAANTASAAAAARASSALLKSGLGGAAPGSADLPGVLVSASSSTATGQFVITDRHDDDEDVPVCEHDGCNFISLSTRKVDKKNSTRKHERRVALHKDTDCHDRSTCRCCQKLIAAGVWRAKDGDYELVKNEKAAAAAAAQSSSSSAGIRLATTTATTTTTTTTTSTVAPTTTTTATPSTGVSIPLVGGHFH